MIPKKHLISNKKEGVIIRLKKDKIKINASLSAICTKLNLIPTKVVEEFKKIAEKTTQKKFMVLLKLKDTSFEVELLGNPDVCYLKQFKSENDEKLLESYAKQTLTKSNALNLKGRLSELKGILRSMTKEATK